MCMTLGVNVSKEDVKVTEEIKVKVSSQKQMF